MLRSYRGFIFAALVGLATAASSYGQVPGGGNQVAQKTQGTKSAQQQSAPNPLGAGKIDNRKKASQPDCGTPKECRAEQHEKDDLIAQQVAAKAATDQASLSRWQTFIATVGVMAVIATLIYTHMATRAALGAVSGMQQVERARLAIGSGDDMVRQTSTGWIFDFVLSNTGKTTAILRESAFAISHSNVVSEFAPTLHERHNLMIASGDYALVHEILIGPFYGSSMYISGFYEWETVFGPKRYKDYFCYEVTSPNSRKWRDATGNDWPPDS
jgi:hypothetical protein